MTVVRQDAKDGVALLTALRDGDAQGLLMILEGKTPLMVASMLGPVVGFLMETLIEEAPRFEGRDVWDVLEWMGRVAASVDHGSMP